MLLPMQGDVSVPAPGFEGDLTAAAHRAGLPGQQLGALPLAFDGVTGAHLQRPGEQWNPNGI